jgi:hypothetical protein
MTSFLKRLSKLSWDSPSLKVTVANRLTSLLPDKSAGKKKPGVHCAWLATGSPTILLRN